MMRRRTPLIPLRRPIYIGCEGASEVGYAALLQDLANEAGSSVFLKIEELAPGAGDPLARINMAVRRIDILRRKRTAPDASFVFLDDDQNAREPERADRARRMAGDYGIKIIWQIPCFEAVLLRHLPDRAARRPPDTPEAQRALEREWLDYRKPMSRTLLGRRIDLPAVRRAAAVEPERAGLLRCIGLL